MTNGFVITYRETWGWITEGRKFVQAFERDHFLLLKETADEPKSGYHVFPQRNIDYATVFPTFNDATAAIERLRRGYCDSKWLDGCEIRSRPAK